MSDNSNNNNSTNNAGLQIISEKICKSTDVLMRTYRYRNFEIQYEKDMRGELLTKCDAKNTRFPEFRISAVQNDGPSLFSASICSSKPEVVKGMAEELRDAAELLVLLNEMFLSTSESLD